jgi:enoyl-CoA hydratase
MNALNAQVIRDLDEALSALDNMTECRAVILTGSGGKAFVAGADIKEMENYGESEAREMAERGQRVFDRLENFSKPVIAAVNGFALGGGLELALSCDFMLASEKARLGLPEVSLGLIPGYGGTQRLSRVVGKAWARRLILTGEMIDAGQARDIGLVTETFAPEALMPAALHLAALIASRAPLALHWAKRAVNEGFEMEQVKGLELERRFFAETFKTEDHHEGIAAFVGKRRPEFTGN